MEQATASPDTAFTHTDLEVNGVRLHCVEAGEGPLLILLHGFPEFWYSWRHQIPALAEAGFHVVAPDMRGYNLSDKPEGVDRYTGEELAGEVAGLVRHFGAERAVVAGHDWGGGVAWSFAMRHGDLLDRLVILDAPHPARLLQSFKTLRQLRKSWYMFFFQLPRLPEAALRARDYAFVRKGFERALEPGEIDRYVEAIARPGALTAAVNYYRAAFRRFRDASRGGAGRIEQPVLLIWGEHDPFVGPDLAHPDARHVADARVEVIPGVGHWVQNEAPERVTELMLGFLKPA